MKSAEAAERFFKVVAYSPERIMSVGIVEIKIRSQQPEGSNDRRKQVALASSVASSLQMQLMALFYDQLFRCKNVRKFEQLLKLHPGWQSVSVFFSIIAV